MLISYNLLKQYLGFDLSLESLAHKLTMQGLEVEGIIHVGSKFNNVVVGQIKAINKHSNANRLLICTVSDGNEELQIICGASNMLVNDRVCLAKVGAKLANNLNIKKAKIRGVESFGMLCSKSELAIKDDQEGIWILPNDAVIGSNINDYLPKEDDILDITLTANRGDCLSHIGIVREISAMGYSGIKYPDYSIKVNNAVELPNVKIVDSDLCMRYASRIIRGVKIAESPKWLKDILINLGSRPINNVVDISNFVLLELGHPLHAFDLSKINGKQIIVRRAGSNEDIVTIDGLKRSLDNNMLIIADKHSPIAIAGVMGGLNSSITNSSIDLLLESAYFLPQSIRQTSKSLDLQTDSSYRFERGTDWGGIVRALDRCANLIQSICGGEISDLTDVYPMPIEKAKINLNTSFVNNRLGTKITNKMIKSYLEPLEFEIEEKDNNNIVVNVPSFKYDVFRDIDVVEEIARIYGYDNIEETIPPIRVNPDYFDTHYVLGDRIKYILNGFGLSETINFSFVAKNDFEKLKLPYGNIIEVRNPLNFESQFLRNSLCYGMVLSVQRNVNHGNKALSLFEIGNIFHKDGDLLIEEKNLVIALYGLSDKDIYSDERVFDFFDLKGIVEGLFSQLGICDLVFRSKKKDLFHPSGCASIMLDDKEIGYIGILSSELQSYYKVNYPLILCEVFINRLEGLSLYNRVYSGISKYPEVLRDIAILVDENIAANNVITEIKNASSYLSSVKLLDIYKGKHIPKGRKSMAFSLIFQDKEKTLSDDLVDKEFDSIVLRLRKNCGGEMREV